MKRIIETRTPPTNSNADDVGDPGRILRIGAGNCVGHGIYYGLVRVDQVAGIVLAKTVIRPSSSAWADKQMEIIVDGDFARIVHAGVVCRPKDIARHWPSAIELHPQPWRLPP